jgi:hypothetical protein
MVKEYTKKPYTLSIYYGQSDEGDQAITRYINDLQYVIQYELSMLKIWFVAKAYQCVFKVEDNLSRKQQQFPW